MHAVCPRRPLLMTLLAAWIPTIVCGVEPAAAEGKNNKVTVVVDYGDGVQKHFTELAWRESMTVLDALLAAQAHPRGIRLEYRGAGATALLIQIDNLANEGRGKNWIYRVNGKLGDTGIGVRQLAPGDSVLWKFEVYR